MPMPDYVVGLLILSALPGTELAAPRLDYAPVVVAVDPAPWLTAGQPPASSFRMPRFAEPEPRASGLIATVPILDNIRLGVGRFSSSAPRRRSHVETEPRPVDMRRGERGIAAVGVSVRF